MLSNAARHFELSVDGDHVYVERVTLPLPSTSLITSLTNVLRRQVLAFLTHMAHTFSASSLCAAIVHSADRTSCRPARTLRTAAECIGNAPEFVGEGPVVSSNRTGMRGKSACHWSGALVRVLRTQLREVEKV